MSSSDTRDDAEPAGDRERSGPPPPDGGSRVLRERGYRWEDVPLRAYRDEKEADHFRDVTRQTLLGEGGGEGALSFLTRYFEIEPGGYSSLERHRHPHSVIVVRGRGEVVLGEEVHEIEPFDCVYVAPGEAHRFRPTGEDPLGFLCIVDRERDRPELVEEGPPEPS